MALDALHLHVLNSFFILFSMKIVRMDVVYRDLKPENILLNGEGHKVG